MKFDDHRTMAAARNAGAAVEPARSSVGRMADGGGGARYADEEHAMRSRPRTYLQPVGTSFDRNLLR